MFDIWPVMNKCTVVAKRELFYAWPFGLAAWLCGLIFIDRMQSDKARNSLCDATDLIKEKKIKLWIFPEGTRRNTGEIHSFKKGAFHVAIAGQIPILPVVFSSYKTFLDDENRNMTSGEWLHKKVSQTFWFELIDFLSFSFSFPYTDFKSLMLLNSHFIVWYIYNLLHIRKMLCVSLRWYMNPSNYYVRNL